MLYMYKASATHKHDGDITNRHSRENTRIQEYSLSTDSSLEYIFVLNMLIFFPYTEKADIPGNPMQYCMLKADSGMDTRCVVANSL